MEYTIQKLGRLAGISTRTLRYYDEIDLLKPARINSSGYRIYGEKEVDLLQQIMFYRALDVSLDKIKDFVNAPTFDGQEALKSHLNQLLAKRTQIDELIANVKKTLASTEGSKPMKDHEKFEGLKKKLIEDNEKAYGKEIRQKYGDEAIAKSNKKVMNMSLETYEKASALAGQIKLTLKKAFEIGDPHSALAQEAVALHKEWLLCYWDQYTPAYHVGLSEMYVADDRFRAYYDEVAPGVSEFLRDAIYHFTGIKKED